jgi:hypothetical protein
MSTDDQETIDATPVESISLDASEPEPEPEHLDHEPTLRARVRERVAELVRMRNAGQKLTTGQSNLIDFWLVDCSRRDPPDQLTVSMLRAAESTENAQWRR